MNAALTRMVDDAAGRYLNADEAAALLAYADSLRERLALADAVRDAEAELVREAIGRTRAAHPEFFTRHGDPEGERSRRDMALVLRASVTAMICDDAHMQEEQLLLWLRTMFVANHIDPTVMRHAYTALGECVADRLGPEHYRLLAPFLAANVEALGTIPALVEGAA